MGASHTTVYNVVDILNEYNNLRDTGIIRVSANTIYDNIHCKSRPTIQKIIHIYESLKEGIEVKPDKQYSELLINMVKLYDMYPAAPKILNGWRHMELLEDADSVRSAAHVLVTTYHEYESYQQYMNIHKVFSYNRDNKLNDGVPNKQMHDIADAYFDIVGRGKKPKKSIRSVSHNNNVTTKNVTLFNNDTTQSCNNVFPGELIELLKIENELKQLKEKESELLIKKDALVTALNAQVNN